MVESISNDLAQKLEKLTNISMKTWLNLQASYDRKWQKGEVPLGMMIIENYYFVS